MPGDGAKIAVGVAVGVGALTATAVGLTYWYKHRLANTPPKRWRRIGELSEIIYYPIKSCAPIKVSRAQCQQLGLQDGNLRDRVFMIITPEGQFVTARAQPRLVLIQPHIAGDTLTLSAPGMLDISLSFADLHTKQPITASVWQQPVSAIDCGEEVAKWLSRYICSEDVGLRLVFYPSAVPTRPVRKSNWRFQELTQRDAGALHDASSYMLMTEASLADLNGRMAELNERDVPALQFRPNLLVKGPGVAFEEDTSQWVRIGASTVFRNVKMCTRCIFTNIDPVTAQRNEAGQPLKLLKEYRKVIEGESPVMGVHLGIRTVGAEVSVGDAVYVEERGQ